MLTACSSSLYYVLTSSGPFSVNVENGNVRIQGTLGQGDGATFLAAVAGRQIKSITVNSSGGEVNDGIEIGNYVFEYRLPVEVAGVCNSSCANYVIAASPTVTVRPGSVILFHGGVLAGHDAALDFIRDSIPIGKQEEALNYFRNTEANEISYLRKVGVDIGLLALSGRFVAENKVNSWAPTQSEMNCYGYHIGPYIPLNPQGSTYLLSEKSAFPPALKCVSRP